MPTNERRKSSESHQSLDRSSRGSEENRKEQDLNPPESPANPVLAERVSILGPYIVDV